jgi:hypothetical protein
MMASVLTQIRILYQAQSYDDALIVLERYATSNEQSTEMLLLKSRLIQLSETGRHDLSEAKHCLLQVLERDAENAKAMLELGWLCLNVFDEVMEARGYFNQALAVTRIAEKEATEGLKKCEHFGLH